MTNFKPLPKMLIKSDFNVYYKLFKFGIKSALQGATFVR